MPPSISAGVERALERTGADAGGAREGQYHFFGRLSLISTLCFGPRRVW